MEAITDRLWHIARLEWRTLPYAFARSGQEPRGPVAVCLAAPDGSIWSFEADSAMTTVRGPALDFCLVAGRRLAPAMSSLEADGPAKHQVDALPAEALAAYAELRVVLETAPWSGRPYHRHNLSEAIQIVRMIARRGRRPWAWCTRSRSPRHRAW